MLQRIPGFRQTLHYPCPSLCNHTGPRPTASPGPGNHSRPLPRFPRRRPPSRALQPLASDRLPACLPNGSLSSSASLSRRCLLSGDLEVWLSSWTESPKKDVTGTGWCACECMHGTRVSSTCARVPRGCIPGACSVGRRAAFPRVASLRLPLLRPLPLPGPPRLVLSSRLGAP